MRLPALALAAAFVAGIALGLQASAARNASSAYLLVGCCIASFLLILGGMILARFARLLWSTLASLTCWILLGFLSACLAEQPRPANHVTALIESGQLSLQTPLRWHGHLRDEPAILPWGIGLEMELSGVEFDGTLRPATGGLRISLSPPPDSSPLPDLRAGDEIEVLSEARRPQVFRDRGAFDRRAYLAGQNIDLVATLRATQLVKRVSSSPMTASIAIAHVRRRLREEIDALCA